MYSAGDTLAGGLPHSDIHVSTPARGSPWLFAACHVLHRLLVPRHPPNALLILDIPDTTPFGRASIFPDNHPFYPGDGCLEILCFPHTIDFVQMATLPDCLRNRS